MLKWGWDTKKDRIGELNSFWLKYQIIYILSAIKLRKSLCEVYGTDSLVQEVSN